MLLFTSTLRTSAPEMAALQVQLVQQSWEEPTSSSSGPWTAQAGKPLHESGKVLRVLEAMSLLIVLHRDRGQEGTGVFMAPLLPFAEVSSERAAT